MMRKINCLLTFFLLCAAMQTFAQGGRIEGYIYNLDSVPLANLEVRLQNTDFTTKTNDKGFYRLDNIPGGAYKIVFQAINDEETRKVQVVPDFTTDLKRLYLPLQLQRETTLETVEVYPAPDFSEVKRMPEVKDNVLYAGKKNEVIQLEQINANTAMNNTRQVFAKVPGANFYENDGSGIQVGLATRGLSPNRSWEYNVRQNGYDIAADPYGYPEAYYSPPMEAVDRIEVIRGAASLQFGPQFGGMLNYVTKKGNPNKKFSIESQQTVGSYGMFNSFNAIGGQVGKLNYYSYINYRRGDGWRANSEYSGVWAYAALEYKHRNLTLGVQVSGQTFKNQQPGGLTEATWNRDHRTSNRTRNWFSAPWLVPTAYMNYAFSPQTNLSVKVFGLAGERNSVGYVRPATTPDTLTLKRQVDRDLYANIGGEARFSHIYRLCGSRKSALAVGVRYFSGNTDRKQVGIGNEKTEYDISLTQPNYARDLELQTTNTAFFAENSFHLFKNFKIVPGIRWEYVGNKVDGRFSASENVTFKSRENSFVLYGIGWEWGVASWMQLYANYSQGYRPILFSDLIPTATTDRINPDLKNADGSNFDIGLRGAYNNLFSYDVNYFRLDYNNRIGTIRQTENGQAYNYRTNIAGSQSTGAEIYFEMNLFGFCKSWKNTRLKAFYSGAFVDAKYNGGTAGTVNLNGKRVEYAPQRIYRIGATFEWYRFGVTYQFGHVSQQYSDATNTETPSANGVAGKIPAYELMDLSITYRFLKYFNVKGGLNNLANRKYFTRRAGGYPGPGIIPGDGRTFYFSVGINF